MLSHSPQGQIPFPSSYSLRRGHTSILQVALHQHHQGYWCELIVHDLISQLWEREREREVDFGTILRSMGMSMNGLMLEQLWECLDSGGCPDIATNFVTRKHLCGKCLNTRTLTLPPPTFHRNTFSIVFLPQKVSHELYRQLYPNIIRDIDVNS